MLLHPNTPVLIGVGQTVSHWDGTDADQAPSPLSLSCAASLAALNDTGAAAMVSRAIDVIAVVRTNMDSVTGAKPPFPQCANPPRALARDLGLSPHRAIYSTVGGDQPQALVNEFAEAIFRGEAGTVLLSGAEAISAIKTASRKRQRLDWSSETAGDMEDRGIGTRLLSDYELSNGFGFPTQTYPVFEHALRTRLGLDRDTYRHMISEIWHRFSSIAAQNPYAQFPVERSVEFLETVSADNYEVADPYLKWHVAQDAVNQGAAVILTSVAQAERLGVDPSRWIYLHGYAQVKDAYIMERPDLSRSRAMELVLSRALQAAGKTAGDLAEIDLYSCFPCAVLIASEALGIDWRSRDLTVTGGLPFFGGAGNNYSMHAIATMAERLRANPGTFGLILANGGFLSKEAAGIYSTTPAENWSPVSSTDLQARIDQAEAPALLSANAEAEAVIDSFTVTYKKGTPQRGYVLAHTPNGRVLARAVSGHRATLTALAAKDPIGKHIRIRTENATNVIVAPEAIGSPSKSDFMSRSFRYVDTIRHGNILEVILNRPDQMNALHSAAHFELHEIWDEFERDTDLWVAVITGAGSRAFCSGNDLKATARGADQSTPYTGFAGLCSRFNREKPVIAAVNGVAMGGGLEIVLACDLAVADENARFALPEVKVGLFAAAGGVQRLTRQIGRKAATELILTGRHFGAEEALRLGVVNEIAPEEETRQRAFALADAILANSPSAVRASKQALNKLEEIEDLKAALAANGPIMARLARTKDLREGVTAFAEKRPPKWTNS